VSCGRCDWWNIGQFTLYTREAGAGRLSLAMEGPSKTDIYVEDLMEGTCDVAYTCTEPGPLQLLSVFLQGGAYPKDWIQFPR